MTHPEWECSEELKLLIEARKKHSQCTLSWPRVCILLSKIENSHPECLELLREARTSKITNEDILKAISLDAVDPVTKQTLFVRIKKLLTRRSRKGEIKWRQFV